MLFCCINQFWIIIYIERFVYDFFFIPMQGMVEFASLTYFLDAELIRS